MTNRDSRPMAPPIASKPIRRGALGKGITSLLGDIDQNDPLPATGNQGAKLPTMPGKDTELRGKGELANLRISDIEPNPQQPRKIFHEGKLHELAQSLKIDGLLQPVVVARSETNKSKYVLIAGERRWRASQLAGLESIPAVIKDCASDDMLRLALIENIQRADLNVVEEAEAYQVLIRDYGLTQEQCAERVGKDRTTVTNALRILTLPREIQDDLVDGRLTMGHARALLSLDEKRHILQARDIVIKKAMNVRQTEAFTKSFKTTQKPTELDVDANLDYIADRLRNKLRTKVKIIGTSQRGRIEVSYFSEAELERLTEVLEG